MSAMLTKGEWVWVDSHIGVSIGGRVTETHPGRCVVVDDEGKERTITSEQEASVRAMHPTSVEGVDDMIRLGDLTEAGLLRNLLVRHRQGIIYTFTGSVLVAVNPYKELPIYTAEQVRLYRGRQLGELPPHIFAVANACYFDMRRFDKDQCCIISGESGAGKTESSKLILQFLAAVSGQHSWIEQQILESNPILEAFGNAKTTRNDNSSRFGKYLEVFFNGDGVIEGARIEQYLLEKSRVCHQASEERNYHIFYCMLAGITPEQRKKLSLKDATKYTFLTKGDRITCEGRDDAQDFARIWSALQILTFSESQRWDILKTLAAILHLGNVGFEATSTNNMDSSEVSESRHFSFSSALLKVRGTALEKSLTHRSLLTNREMVTKPLTTEQASNCRDALVKAIYNKLFIWIVGRINSVIHKTSQNSPGSCRRSIGLLDIFGFENFNSNSFEQLCINLANEELQQFFVRHVFKLEQDEYLREGVVWTSISFIDNQQTLDLLAGKPCNLLALIDEESHFPKGTDDTLLNKMNQQHGRNSSYIPSKTQLEKDFGVNHFAGAVHYDTNGFLEKNRDAISRDIIEMIDTSGSELLHQIFENELSNNSEKNPGNSRVIMTPRSSLRSLTDGRKQMPTLSGQFRHSLDSLMKALSACQPFFIRCFKPNERKQSESFDRKLCMLQLSYSGMMDTVRIHKLGFPIRHTFKDFLGRYRVLLRTAACNPKTETAMACCKVILEDTLPGDGQWEVGKTKVFLKDSHDALLELELERILCQKAAVIQRAMLAHRDRTRFVRKRKATVVLQRRWRSRTEHQHRKLTQGFERLSARVHGRQLQLHYQRQRAAAVTIQSRVRGYRARKSWEQQREAAIVLQACTRGMLARRQAERMRTDLYASTRGREDQARVESELQWRLEAMLAGSLQDTEFGFPVAAGAAAVGGRRGAAPEDFEFEDLEMDRNAAEGSGESNTETEAGDPDSCSPSSSPLLTPLPTRSPTPPDTRQPTPPPPPGPPSLPAEDEDDEDDEDDDEDYDDYDDGAFAFSQFASRHFCGDATHTHIGQRLRQPLLAHEYEGDALDTPRPVCHERPRQAPLWSERTELGHLVLPGCISPQSIPGTSFSHRACLTVWWIIMRFMGDIPEPKQQRMRSPSSPALSSSVERQGRRLSHLVGLDEKILRKNKKKFGGGNRRGSTIVEEPEDITEEEEILIGEGPTLDRPLSPLEKVHIIVGYALSRPDIRDEIYCQICKQLVGNNKKESRLRGWTLLALCLGIFPPSPELTAYLQNFLRRGPSGYGAYCTDRLRRVMANGGRAEPPCWIELQATKSKMPLEVSVALMDDRSFTLPVDSSCTAAEVCHAVTVETKLRDTYGFSLYISLYDKMWSLGSGGKHVMDAISQCEQEARRRGGEEHSAPWRLCIRKELFTPWHDCSEDPISTDLIYRQVIGGLKFGEYTCEKEDEYVLLAAKHNLIQFGYASDAGNMAKAVEECIATSLIETKSLAKWIQLVSSARSQGDDLGAQKNPDDLKAEIVDLARQKWPLYFSKFYEVTMMSGPPLPKNRFVAAVNWSGIFFVDGRDATLLELPYVEVTGVHTISDGKSSGRWLSLAMAQEEFVLECVGAEDMAALIRANLEGLRRRSVFALATRDSDNSDDPSYLPYKRGDLLMMARDGDFSAERGWNRATNEQTGGSGVVPMDAVQFLPTLTRPQETTLNLFQPSPYQRRKSLSQSLVQREETVAPISLKEYGFENFRQPSRESKTAGRERLWACSKEPLKQPILKSLAQRSDLSPMACNAFIAILKYMGDYPVKQSRSAAELTDQIFGPATQHEALQDEVYCQIMRQMTNNNNRLSMERGWQLMWLCTGLFPPSPNLMRHTQRFLESRPRDPLAGYCLQRLQSMLRTDPRKRPPHQVEVDAVQQNSTQIFHKVHFPNDTDDLFEVTSTTTIRDLCLSIASQLILSSADGYALFMKTPTKVLSLDDQMYFFDSLRQTSDQPKKAKKVKEGIQSTLPYLVIFMRKLWFNVIPGRDLTADLTFHFPQELPKYLQGFHKCTKEEMISLAGLLFRVKSNSDRSQFVMIPKMLQELVPSDQIKSMPTDEWKKHIMSSYNKQAGVTVEEAKVAFLRTISTWPTFGCAFFEVKQTSESKYPSMIRIAVSKQGISLINPKSKELLVMHPFSRITTWSSGSNFFQMTISSSVKANNFHCETQKGYRMGDLLGSYISMYEHERKAVRPRNLMFSEQPSPPQNAPLNIYQ